MRQGHVEEVDRLTIVPVLLAWILLLLLLLSQAKGLKAAVFVGICHHRGVEPAGRGPFAEGPTGRGAEARRHERVASPSGGGGRADAAGKLVLVSLSGSCSSPSKTAPSIPALVQLPLQNFFLASLLPEPLYPLSMPSLVLFFLDLSLLPQSAALVARPAQSQKFRLCAHCR